MPQKPQLEQQSPGRQTCSKLGAPHEPSVVTGSDDAGIEGDAGAEGDAPLGAGDDEGATDGAGDAGLLGAGEIIGVGDR